MSSPLETDAFDQFRAVGNIPEIVFTTPDSPSIGAIIIPAISSGDLVPISDVHAIEADFDAIELLSNRLAGYLDDYERLDKENESWITAGIEHPYDDLDPSTQQLFRASVFAGRAASEFFSLKLQQADPKKAAIFRQLVGWRVVDRDAWNAAWKRLLSESGKMGVCSEISIFSKEVLNRAGFDVAFANGYTTEDENEEALAHSFLTTSDKRVIIDPTLMISGGAKVDGDIEGLYVAHGDQSFVDTPTAYRGMNHASRYYSTTTTKA